ncbi:MAG: lysylphosphatidylglycerol synthase domain-containing protein, partial [Mucilaginibacter sp.]
MSWVLKAAILALAAWFIYHKFLTKNEDLHQFKALISKLDRKLVIVTLSAVSLLMLINWFLEALKWQYVTRKLIEITRWEAIESVFCGLTWAIITPNRVGEYGGRIMFLPNRKRIHGLFAMIVGGLGQNLVT